MKRLLLPLLAALSLPAAVNAETIYLECKFEKYEHLLLVRKGFYPYHLFN